MMLPVLHPRQLFYAWYRTAFRATVDAIDVRSFV